MRIEGGESSCSNKPGVLPRENLLASDHELQGEAEIYQINLVPAIIIANHYILRFDVSVQVT